MKFALVAAAFFATAAVSSQATADSSPSWLCIGDQAVGYQHTGSEWRVARFQPGKYIVSRADNPLFAWEVRVFGEPKDAVLAHCRNDFDPKIGELDCSFTLAGADFTFNRITLKFTMIEAPVGYTNDGAPGLEGLPSPTMEFGTCSPI